MKEEDVKIRFGLKPPGRTIPCLGRIGTPKSVLGKKLGSRLNRTEIERLLPGGSGQQVTVPDSRENGVAISLQDLYRLYKYSLFPEPVRK